MKKWFRFFGLSFFSNKISKESVKRGYSNAFLGFTLALVFMWVGFLFGDMLPFGVHYNNSPDFKATVHTVLANTDAARRIDAKIEDGILKAKKPGGEYTEGLLINTFESDADREVYSVNGYGVVVDTRPAGTLAEVEAYCVSNDGKNTAISYSDYLTLSDVAKLNFDFKLKYTGKELELDDETVAEYLLYLDGTGDENKSKIAELTNNLAESRISKNEFNTEIYKLYFTNYYPEITSYEATSKVPLLRNYYYHEYVSKDVGKYFFIFNDCMLGSFETKGGIKIQFYGFYSELEEGYLLLADDSADKANAAADRFIKSSFRANIGLNAYAYFVNTVTIVPFIALMLMVATLLTYSLLRLNGVESISSLGAMIKIVGSYVWFSGAVSGVLSIVIMLFANRSLINVLPPVLFFMTLVVRSIVFATAEARRHKQQSEQQKTEQTEV